MKTRDKQDIINFLQRHQQELQNFGVKKIGLFGSFVRNEQKDNSDIDFLVEFVRGKKTYDNFIELAFLLEDQLERHVELITPESLSPYIGPVILQEVEYVSISH